MLCIPRLSEILSCRLPHLNWITKNLKTRIRCSKAFCLLQADGLFCQTFEPFHGRLCFGSGLTLPLASKAHAPVLLLRMSSVRWTKKRHKDERVWKREDIKNTDFDHKCLSCCRQTFEFPFARSTKLWDCARDCRRRETIVYVQPTIYRQEVSRSAQTKSAFSTSD